jgi:hypothetical protein
MLSDELTENSMRKLILKKAAKTQPKQEAHQFLKEVRKEVLEIADDAEEQIKLIEKTF